MATVRDLVRVAVRAAREKKATDVKAIDIRGLSSVTDYMIIASGSSDTNVRAIAGHVREKLLEKHERPFSLEGLQEGTWVLLDYVDFVVHVFHHDKRPYFGLEELWADAKPVSIADTSPRKAAPRAAAKRAAKPATKPAVRSVRGESPPPGPRATLKPSAKTRAVPKKGAAKKATTARKTAAPGKAAPAKKVSAQKRTAVPKPKKAAVPKRKMKG